MSARATNRPEHHPRIIFFDGICGMCNGFVDLMLRADKKRLFRFAPLQGRTARESLPALPPDPGQWSMLYLDERGIHEESDASLEVLRRVGGGWWFLSLVRLIPRWIRNPVYRFIARHRYRWFGRRETCRAPTEEERPWFLP